MVAYCARELHETSKPYLLFPAEKRGRILDEEAVKAVI
jgi:hypothetical protein